MSLRWSLILFAWSLALAMTLVLTLLLHLRSERRLLLQLEKTLETKCDEVITVMENGAPHPTLTDFFLIETSYRFTPYTYFYQVQDADRRILARSDNLGALELPLPEAWETGTRGNPVHLHTGPRPGAPEEHIRIRSERVQLGGATPVPRPVVIQVAVSLGPLESAVSQSLGADLLAAALGLGAVLSLLWFVTSRSLQPVTEMTRKASRITATNLRERLPLTGRDDELDRLAEVLNDMLDRLGGSLRQMEQFSSDAAHQLRTPLTRIRGELDLLLRGNLADPPKSQLERIQEELERLSRMCGRLLLLAQLDQQSESKSLFDEPLDLEPLVSELVEQMAPLAHDRGVSLRQGATATARVKGSRPLLVEALLNLLDNAIRFTPTGGSVAVSIQPNGEMVRLNIEDNGPGIPKGRREQVFQRFYRIPRSSTGGTDEGSGLGLAIVKGIAQAHGGRVELDEAAGGGSVFRLVLPLRPGS